MQYLLCERSNWLKKIYEIEDIPSPKIVLGVSDFSIFHWQTQKCRIESSHNAIMGYGYGAQFPEEFLLLCHLITRIVKLNLPQVILCFSI